MRLWALALMVSLSPAVCGAQPLLDAEGGAEGISRHLSYRDDLFHRMNGYDLAAAPGVYVRAAFSPGAWTRRPLPSSLALTAAADYLFAPDSEDLRGAPIAVRAWGYSLGLRARLPAPLPDVGLDVAYVAQRFTLGRSTPGLDGAVPNVAAQSLRVGLSARLPLTPRVALRARAAYLAALSSGTAQQIYFPRMSSAAVEAAVGVDVALSGALSLRAAVEYRRYFSTVNPEPGDAWVVGGALDQYVTATLGVGWRR